MKNLFSLLERVSRVLNKDTALKDAIASVIESKSRVKLEHKSFSLKDGVLKLEASPAAKNEIRLNEETIRAELKEAHHIFISRILYK